MQQTSPDTQKFDRLSRQVIKYTDLPNGGVRARMVVSVPIGSNRWKPYTFIEDVTADGVQAYESQIQGAEIGYVMQEVSGIYGAYGDEIGFLGALIKAVGKGVSAVGKGIVKGVKAVAKVAKAVVTSKVMQTAAKGLAMVAPALGPFAPIAMGTAGAIGVAGKILGAKNAEQAGATRTAVALTQSAISDANRIAPRAAGSLLRIARDKAASAQRLAGTFAKTLNRLQPKQPSYASRNAMTLAQNGQLFSSRGGPASPSELQLAHSQGRVFFLPAAA